MKKLFFATISALAIAGVVNAADSTEFGVMNVPSNAKETIVAVPWLESTTTVSAVTVSNLVLTSGLAVGDQLLHYNGTSYDSWVIAEKDNVKYWTPGNNVTETKATISGASDSVTIARGSAVILKRASPGDKGFYIMGKPAASGVKMDLGAGYSLVAPPTVNTADTDVNSGMTWANIEAGDQLFVPVVVNNKETMTTLTYKKNKGWGKLNSTTHVWEKTGAIPSGMGAWFKNNGTGSNKSFTFGTPE